MPEVQHILSDLSKMTAKVAQDNSSLEEVCRSHPDGVSLLQARSATLMRYINNLLRFTLARVQGKPVQSIIDALVKDYVVLTKLRPMEKSLARHFDNLLRDSDRSVAPSISDDHGHRPNPKAFISGSAISAGEEKGDMDGDDEPSSLNKAPSGQYRPPRLAQVVDEEPVTQKKKRQRNTGLLSDPRLPDVAEAVATIRGYPREVRDESVQSRVHTSANERERSMRVKYEEDNFTRLPTSKQELKRRRTGKNPGDRGAAQVSQFSELIDSANRIATSKSKGEGATEGRRGPSKAGKRKRFSR